MKAVPIVNRSTGDCGLLVEVSTDGFAVVVGLEGVFTGTIIAVV
jgi:hypothetical protein